jgi:hypothetical protein
MQVNRNPYNLDYLTKLASHQVEPTLERLNELDWKKVSDVIVNSKDYVHLRETQAVLQAKVDKIAEAEKVEALKQADMNPVHRAFYKIIQKPIAQWWEKIKPQEKELPPLRENWNRGVNLFND